MNVDTYDATGRRWQDAKRINGDNMQRMACAMLQAAGKQCTHVHPKRVAAMIEWTCRHGLPSNIECPDC